MRFPKAFLSVTSEDGYSLYRRRNDDRVVNVGGARLDNRWVYHTIHFIVEV